MRFGRPRGNRPERMRTIGTARRARSKPRRWRAQPRRVLRGGPPGGVRRIPTAARRRDGKKRQRSPALLRQPNWHNSCDGYRQVRALAACARADPGRDRRIASGPHSRTSSLSCSTTKHMIGIRAFCSRAADGRLLEGTGGTKAPAAAILPVQQCEPLVAVMGDYDSKTLAGARRSG
jgi:hypothetical protein